MYRPYPIRRFKLSANASASCCFMTIPLSCRVTGQRSRRNFNSFFAPSDGMWTHQSTLDGVGLCVPVQMVPWLLLPLLTFQVLICTSRKLPPMIITCSVCLMAWRISSTGLMLLPKLSRFVLRSAQKLVK